MCSLGKPKHIYRVNISPNHYQKLAVNKTSHYTTKNQPKQKINVLETALTQTHITLGAKMVPFAGYNMPVSYQGIKAEHLIVRSGVGIFDVSHMGEFLVEGKNALDLIQFVTTNDASKLTDGKVQYSCLPNGKGGIVDDLLVYKIADEKFMLVVNASNIEKDWSWISSHNKWGVQLTDLSAETTLLAVQGPAAISALQSLTQINLSEMAYYTFEIGEFAGITNAVVSATGYTGAGGFEIYVPNQHAQTLWNAIFEAGAAHQIAPIGLGARDTLRLEMGYCLYGHDIDDATSPLEAGLGWITKLQKDGDFIDKAYLLAQKAAGITRKLVGFEMMERGIARQHYPICSQDGTVIGEVTSGTESPSTAKLIGMGYVQTPHSAINTQIYIKIREKLVPATVAKMPFVNPSA